MVATEGEVRAMITQGEEEVGWSTHISILWTTLHTNPEIMDPEVWADVINHHILIWPQSLQQRLPWGPEAHFGHLGGISG